MILVPCSSPFTWSVSKTLSEFYSRSLRPRNDAVTTFNRNYTSWCHDGGSWRGPLSIAHQQAPGESRELSYLQVFESQQVKPPFQVPPRIWRWCYYVHRASLRLLHFFDPWQVPNSALAGLILWWKALVGNDRSSRAFDHGWAHDFLPSGTRWIVRYFRPWFPRLNHANIELRSVYLNDAVKRVLSQENGRRKVTLVVLGSGYDLRGTRLLSEGVVDDVVELDLPEVMLAKKNLLTHRLARRRSNLRIPKLVCVDLNDVAVTQGLLYENLGQDNGITVFILEGILVHLSADAGHALLGMLSSLSTCNPSSSSYLVFADALPHVTQRRLEEAITELDCQGWTLVEYLANPTKAPHMGIAVPKER